MDRQSMLNSTVALVKTAVAFALPLVVNTSATKVYSGPVTPAIRGLIPDHPVLDSAQHERLGGRCRRIGDRCYGKANSRARLRHA
jgi:hypothetical protein